MQEKMSEYVFLFDLDSTITKLEILPEISKKIGKEIEMRKLTEETMSGELPFKQSFLQRVEILKNTSVSKVCNMIKDIPLNEHIVEFISNNTERCYVVTGNLDVWIDGLMKKIGMENHYFCSKAMVCNDRIQKVVSVLDKELVAYQFVQPIITVGDGNNDADIARIAKIAIGFGGVRDVAPALMRNIDYLLMDDKKCAEFLNCLL